MNLGLNDYLGEWIVVEWKDSGTHHSDGWQTKEEILSSAKIETVTTLGYLFHWDTSSMYLAQTYDASLEHFFGTQIIHIPDVVNMKRLAVDE